MTFLVPLLGRQRRTLLRCSLLMCTAVMLLAPLLAPPAFEAQAGDEPAVPRTELPTIPQRLEFPPVVITRDPFVADQSALAASMPTADPDGGGIVLPPNDGATPGAPDAATNAMPIVRAVILGSSPKALVDLAGRIEVVGIGSPLAGSTVAAVDAGGIRLSNGEILAFKEPQP